MCALVVHVRKIGKVHVVDDARLQRAHPDLQPTHRRCPMCPPGSDVHPLDGTHFYERGDRYAWQASRFSKLCRTHDKERRRASYATNAQAQNLRTVQRRQVVRMNKKLAAIFYAPEQIAIADQRKRELRDRKERVARWKRVNLRAHGPRNGIKAMIESRQQMFAEKRLARAASLGRPRPPQASQSQAGGAEERQSPMAALEALRRLRARHRQEQIEADQRRLPQDDSETDNL